MVIKLVFLPIEYQSMSLEEKEKNKAMLNNSICLSLLPDV
jgi:hypothetical protein